MLSQRDYAQDLAELGFADIGSYRDGVFNIEPTARSMAAVYVWMLKESGIATPVRVGETGRVGPRFSSYNGWLRGRQWPGKRRNAREQEKARLTKLRLGSAGHVIAIPVPSKELGLAIERILLDIWQPVLDLNFELPRSWGRARVQEWSAAYDLRRIIGLELDPARGGPDS